MANVNKQLSQQELLQAIRADIAGELEAIIGYEAHIMAATDERVKKVLAHIADEERRMSGNCSNCCMLSPHEQQMFDQGQQQIMQQQAQNFSQPMQ